MNRQRDEGKPWCDGADRYRVGMGKKQTFCCSRGTSSSVWATLSFYIERNIGKNITRGCYTPGSDITENKIKEMRLVCSQYVITRNILRLGREVNSKLK